MKDYTSLTRAGYLLSTYGRAIRMVAWLFLGLNLFIVFIAMVARAGVIGPSELLMLFISVLVTAFISAGIWVTGLFVSAAGDACMALADMAYNSWFLSQNVAIVTDG